MRSFFSSALLKTLHHSLLSLLLSRWPFLPRSRVPLISSFPWLFQQITRSIIYILSPIYKLYPYLWRYLLLLSNEPNSPSSISSILHPISFILFSPNYQKKVVYICCFETFSPLTHFNFFIMNLKTLTNMKTAMYSEKHKRGIVFKTVFSLLHPL